MAYGVLTNTALLAIGLPPAHASALVHTAEIFTTSASAASHIYHRNVDWRMVARLGGTGVLGAILGAWVLSNVEVTAAAGAAHANEELIKMSQNPKDWVMPTGNYANHRY